MKPRTALAAALFTVLPTASACLAVDVGLAHAQPVTACGGQGAMRTVPVGGQAMCQNFRVLRDGVEWSATVIVRHDGGIQVNYNRALPPPVDVPLSVEVHPGGSGGGNGIERTSVLPAGDSSTQMFGQLDPAALAPFDCVIQFDVKAINGNRDTPANRVAIAGPWFRFENCDVPVTVPTTAPTSAPTTSPASTGSSPTTLPGLGSTTAAPTASSVVGGTIPATGPIGDASGIFIAGVFLLGGTALVVLARRSPAS